MGRGRLCAALGVALLAVALAGSAGGAGATNQAVTLVQSGANQQYVPGQVVVGFRSNTDPLTRTLGAAAQRPPRAPRAPPRGPGGARAPPASGPRGGPRARRGGGRPRGGGGTPGRGSPR